MTTAVCQGDLKHLGQQLQTQLRAMLPPDYPLQVQCAFKADMLMVLGQHPIQEKPDPQYAFASLEAAVQAICVQLAAEITAIVSAPEAIAVHLYLRVKGQKQPYTFHSFTLNVVDPLSFEDLPEVDSLTDVTPTTRDLAPESSAIAPEVPEILEAPEILEVPDISEASENSEDLEDATTFDLEAADDPLEDSESLALVAFPDDSFEEASEPEEVGRLMLIKRRPLPLPRWTLALGAVVSFSAFLGGLYALTRPCVIGSCTTIQSAQQLTQAANQTLEQERSFSALLAARQQVAKAAQALYSIPPWSGRYTEAQALHQIEQKQLQILDQVITAQKQAAEAAQKSQNPPHPVQTWEAVQLLWRQAIAHLESVPQDSMAYPLAQHKLQEYQDNLKAINQRVQAERNAEQTLTKAQGVAQVAEARQGIAQSLETWQLVHSTWQVAVNTLKQIPQGTMAHQEAQKLLATYQPKLAAAGDRKIQEQISAQAYNRAVNLAQEAKRLEQQNQWTQAVASWQQALIAAQQVPTGTLYYNQAQPLISTYNASLADAATKLQLTDSLQQARIDLDRTCAGVPKICSYILSNQVIRVYLTPDYLQIVEQTANSAGMSSNSEVLAAVDNHLKMLGVAFEAISDNTKIPIEVYDPNGALIGIYAPS